MGFESSKPASRKQRPPPPGVQASELGRCDACGRTLDLAFTPGGGHIVATVEVDTSSGEGREFRIWDFRTLQRVPVYSQAPNNRYGLGYQVPTKLPLDSYVRGSFILHPLLMEGFLRPIVTSPIRSTTIDQVDPVSNLSFTWLRGAGRLSLPMAASPCPQLMPGFETILAGVDLERRNILRILGWSQDGGRLEKAFAVHHLGITHVTFTGDGDYIITLSKDRWCRLTSLAAGPTTFSTRISTPHSPDMLKSCYVGAGPQRRILVTSIWGSDVAIWYPQDEGSVHNPVVFNLSAALGRAVLPLCITDSCRFLACSTQNGFDIIDLIEWRLMAMGLGAGLYDIKRGAFSSGNHYIAVSTTERIHVYQLLWH